MTTIVYLKLLLNNLESKNNPITAIFRKALNKLQNLPFSSLQNEFAIGGIDDLLENRLFGTVASQICFNFLLVLRRNFGYF